MARFAPGTNCTEGHVRSEGFHSFNSAMAAAEGVESRVVPCFECEVYFVV